MRGSRVKMLRVLHQQVTRKAVVNNVRPRYHINWHLLKRAWSNYRRITDEPSWLEFHHSVLAYAEHFYRKHKRTAWKVYWDDVVDWLRRLIR
jgi:hypothetical protein